MLRNKAHFKYKADDTICIQPMKNIPISVSLAISSRRMWYGDHTILSTLFYLTLSAWLYVSNLAIVFSSIATYLLTSSSPTNVTS